MKRIDELIRMHCPAGVVYLPLWQATIWDKRFNSVDRSKQAKTIKYPHVSASDLKQLSDRGDVKLLSTGKYEGWTSDELAGSNLSQGEVITIPSGGSANLKYWNGKFVDSGNLLGASMDVNKYNLKYVYYFLLSKNSFIEKCFRGSGVKHPDMSQILELKIPFPPIEIQNKIVNILDRFIELESELESELEARRLQHSYYWNLLLEPKESWTTTTLDSIAKIYDGPHATPKKTSEGPWYLSISSLKNGRIDLSESARLGEDQYSHWTRRVAPRYGDTLFSYETRVGQAAYWDRDEPAALGRRMGLLRPIISKVNPRFLTLMYLGPQFQKTINSKTVKGSTVDRIPIARMGSWEVKLPDITEQEEIVRRVDSFDLLVNDLRFGIPAEINSRRKQYEYYRTKLFSFKELSK